MTRTRTSFATVATLATATSLAGAQPAGAQAEVLFRQGRELMASGKIAEACAAFDASEKLEPTVSTVLNQADCRERQGALATAWGLFLEAGRQTRGAVDDASKQMHQLAAQHAAALEPRLSTLRIVVADDARVAGLEIVRDDQVVDLGAWNKPLPIDAGTYRITARAPGNAAWSTTVTVAEERDAKDVEVPRLRAAEVTAVHAAPSAAEPEETAPPAPAVASRRAYYVGAGAVVALGGALALDLVAGSTYDSSKSALDPSTQDSLWHRANAERYGAAALGLAGAGAAGVAVWLYFHDRHTEHAAIAVAPGLVGDRAGIQIAGGF